MNHSNSNVPAKVPHRKIKGKTKAKHAMIAALIARGFPIKDVAQKVNLSESQIYHLLSDKDSFVNVEIFRILSDLFTENDRHLINLYNKSLQKLDNMLSSSDEEKQFRAIDRIIKIFLARSAKNPVTIQQYFGIQSQNEKDFIKNIDDLILKMRKERGLPWPPDYKDSSQSTPNDSPHSPPDDSSKENSSTENSHPDAPLPDPSSPEYKAFVKQIT